MARIVVGTGQLIAPAVAAGAHKLAHVVQAQELLPLQEIQLLQEIIPEEGHQGVQFLGILVEIIEEILKAPEVHGLLGHLIGIPPGIADGHIQDPIEDVVGQGQDLVRLVVVHQNLPVLQLAQIVPVGEAAVNVEGAVHLMALGPAHFDAQIRLGKHMTHGELFGADPVVPNLLLPEDLLPQAVFPDPGQVVPAAELGVGQQLIPGVFRIDEHRRPGDLQAVVVGPELPALLLNGQLRQTGHLLGQVPENFPLLPVHHRLRLTLGPLVAEQPAHCGAVGHAVAQLLLLDDFPLRMIHRNTSLCFLFIIQRENPGVQKFSLFSSGISHCVRWEIAV